MRYLQVHEAPCALKDVGVVVFDIASDSGREKETTTLGVLTEDVRGKVALIDYSSLNMYLLEEEDVDRFTSSLCDTLFDVESQGAVGVLVILADNLDDHKTRLNDLLVSFSDAASIPIMTIPKRDAGALALPGCRLTAFPGA